MVLAWDPVAALTAYGLDTILTGIIGVAFGIVLLQYVYRKVKSFINKS